MTLGYDPAVAVRCLSCDGFTLGGSGDPGDPILDITYETEDGTATWLCPPCFKRILRTGNEAKRN